MKHNIQNSTKIKQLLYGKQVLISSFCFYPVMIALSVWMIILGVTDVDELLGWRIAAILFGLFMLGSTIVLIYNLIKYKAITANITVDKKGVCYRAKSKFFLSWEQIHRIEIKLFQFHSKQMSKPYIVFYSDYTNQKKLPLTANQICDGFIFSHYTWKLHKFIETKLEELCLRVAKLLSVLKTVSTENVSVN